MADYTFVYFSLILVYRNQLSKLSPQLDCALLKSRDMSHILLSLASGPELGPQQIHYSMTQTIAARVEIQPLEGSPLQTFPSQQGLCKQPCTCSPARICPAHGGQAFLGSRQAPVPGEEVHLSGPAELCVRNPGWGLAWGPGALGVSSAP